MPTGFTLWQSKRAVRRKGKSCDDQITRVIENINDGFHPAPMKRSIFVLLDFSKSVWRHKQLLVALDEMGLTVMYSKWQECGSITRLVELTHYSTASPKGQSWPTPFHLLYQFACGGLPTDAINAMFADDIAILATSRDRSEAEALAQASVDTVRRWIKEWKLNLKATKSEVSFFSNCTKESRWEPTIEIDGKRLAFQSFPRLLGVTLDCELTFCKQAENATKTAGKSCRVMAALANTSYGVKKQDLVPV